MCRIWNAASRSWNREIRKGTLVDESLALSVVVPIDNEASGIERSEKSLIERLGGCWSRKDSLRT
jgi:hypothetical protein